jgi:hypothetical protein
MPLFASHRKIKDLAALLYSSLGTGVTKTERLFFYKIYRGGGRLNAGARLEIHRIVKKAKSIRKRDMRNKNRKKG